MSTDLAIEPKVVWIFALLILYWGYCILWGVLGVRHSRSAEDYFLAGRAIPPWVFICAVTAILYSAWTFLGDPGQIYADGLPYAYGENLSVLTMAVPALLFFKRQWILGRHYGFVTPGDMFACYFRSETMRLLVVIVALVFSVPYLGLQLRAAGYLFNVLTNGLVGVEFGMWVLASLVVSYVASGGLWTVARVGVLQWLLLVVGIVILGVLVLVLVGGPSRLLEGIAALGASDPVRTPQGYSHYLAMPGVIQWVDSGPAAQGGPWTGVMTLSYSLALMGIMAAPAFTLWAFASRSPAPFAAQQVWALALVMGLVTLLFSTVQGLGAHLLGADQALLRDYPALVNPVLAGALEGKDLAATPNGLNRLGLLLINLLEESAPWVVGLLALCALAAMESTASCYMATAGAILTRDLLARFLPTRAGDPLLKFAGRLCTVLVVILALWVATVSTEALALMGGLAVSYGLQMWPALIAVCWWPFLTRQGVVLGLVAGLVVVTLTESVGQRWLGIDAWGRWPWTIHAGGWGILTNLTVAILVSAVTRDDTLHKREWHALLRRRTRLPPAKYRLLPWAWTGGLLWLFLGIGPGAVLGNTCFGDPNQPASWWFGLPPLWTWQVLWWLLGIGLLAFLAYYLELATASREDTGRAPL